MQEAPFHADLADGPEGGRAVWLAARDGVRIRAGLWPGSGAAGTVFLLPGRCEYIEKYGRTARDIAARGHATLTLDWRGQGLADRLLKDPCIGHVRRFSDYQLDVAALTDFAAAEGLPRPWVLLAHSMGGCIGLRTLIEGSPFAAAAFSAPMWGIRVGPEMETLARFVPVLAARLGFGNRRTPTTGAPSYLLDTPFEDNMLTTDPEMWAYMVAQTREVERFRLGGPSLNWLAEALAECRWLTRAPRPDQPAHASVGARERIVLGEVVESMMKPWTRGSFTRVPGAEHELLMEKPATRTAFLDRAFATFAQATQAPSRQGLSNA